MYFKRDAYADRERARVEARQARRQGARSWRQAVLLLQDGYPSSKGVSTARVVGHKSVGLNRD